ncbi:MAG: 3-hydroxyacyl-CoA dehydrogenase NAD-binding domain-containing protein [Thermoleophilia bacterium]
MMREPDDIRTVAVLGCGLIGFSWAVVFSRHGRTVNLYNRPSPSLGTAKDRVRASLGLLRREGVIDERCARESLARVRTFDDLAAAVAGADYVQEALPEDLELKQRVFAQVAELTPGEVVIGSSCSGLMRADIVRLVGRHPERCLVAHPTNPPHLLPFMEVAGDEASEEAKVATVRFMEAVGQRPVRCKEVYGHVLNRLQLALLQQALHLVREGICSVEAVEAALTDGLGPRWALTGPYGVEELNSGDLGEGLRKYKAYMLAGFRDLGAVEGYDEEFVQRAVEGFRPLMEGRDHDDYLAWRDRLLVRARALKEGPPAPRQEPSPP